MCSRPHIRPSPHYRCQHCTQCLSYKVESQFLNKNNKPGTHLAQSTRSPGAMWLPSWIEYDALAPHTVQSGLTRLRMVHVCHTQLTFTTVTFVFSWLSIFCTLAASACLSLGQPLRLCGKMPACHAPQSLQVRSRIYCSLWVLV
jgi:hypothetical protein